MTDDDLELSIVQWRVARTDSRHSTEFIELKLRLTFGEQFGVARWMAGMEGLSVGSYHGVTHIGEM